MADLNEEVRKRRTAAALLNGGDDSEDLDSEEDASDVSSSDADTGSTADMGAERAAQEEAAPAQEVSDSAEEKTSNLGYRFVPIGQWPTQEEQRNRNASSANLPSSAVSTSDLPSGGGARDSTGTSANAANWFLGEEGLDVSAALTNAPVYSTPPEQGDQQYVIDQATGAKVPRAQLATSEDLAAQPPSKGAVQLPQEVVSGQAPQVEPAPDQLTQVERGELVKPPPEAPGQLTQVERGELVSVPPGTAPRAVAVGSPPAVQRALPVTPTPPKVQRALGYKFVPVAPAVKPAEPAAPSTAAVPAVPKVQPAQAITTNPNGSDLPQRVQAVGNKDPAAFIVHHTSGRSTVDGVVSTLKERGLGVQFVMDRDGNIFATGGPGAQNILKGWGKGEGLSNQNIVGMEIIAKDDKDVLPVQKQAFARFMAAVYPTTPIYGHGEVNPGHKEADEGLSAKTAALAYRDKLSQGQVAQTPGAPQAQPVTKQANGLYQNEQPQEFLTGKATTFATQEDLASGADNGVGAKNLGRLDTTSVAGVAIPETALRAKYGNNYAAWRQARVDVVDPNTGKRLRLPVVDVGPRGDLSAIVDMTPWVSNYFGGDKNLSVKLVDNAGPDAVKNPQLFADEQAAIRQGFDSSAVQAGVQKIAPKLGYTFKPVVPSAEGAALQQADAFAQQNSRATLAQLPEQNQSLPALINRLDQPIKGVPDAMRRNYQQAVKDEATKYAQDYYGIQDPKAAFAKIMSSPDAGTFLSEIKDKVGPYFNQAVMAFNQSAVVIDQNRLDDLAKAVHPEASTEARKTFINSIISEKDPAQRAANINAIIGNLANENPNNPALAALRATDIADSADRLADPEYQRRQKDEIARQVEQNMRDLRPDPRLQGTAAGWWADQLAQLPKNIVEGITGPVGDSLLISEIYKGTMDRLRQENPGMSEDELKAKIGGSSATQVITMMILNRLSGGKLGTMVGQIENPVARIGASALMHTGIGGTIGAAQQAITNIAEGKAPLEGVLQAAGAGAIQAAPGAILSGIHGRAPVAEERPPVIEERPPVAEERPPVTEPVRPPVEPVRRGEEAEPLPTEQPAVPVTQENVARRAYELYEERQRNGQPGTALDDWAQAQRELRATAASGEPVLPASMGDSEPIISAIANRYRDQRIAQGELRPVEAAQGQSTEEQVAKGLQMSPGQRETLINNMVAGKGGNLDLQMSALRAKELYLSEASKAASRDAMAEPTNAVKQQVAKDALAAITDFHNGPLKEGKRIWSDAGRGLQQEIPVDYTTLNGLKEAYLKFQGKSAPDTLDPVLSGMAKKAQETANNERVAVKGFADGISEYIAGSKRSTDDQVRAELAAIMKNLPCPS